MSSSLYRLFSDRSMTSTHGGIDKKATDYANNFMEYVKNKVRHLAYMNELLFQPSHYYYLLLLSTGDAELQFI